MAVKKRILLSIDGGGIRGILPLMVLSHLNRLVIRERIDHSINHALNFVSGTSTGAIIAASLIVKEAGRYKYLPENILNLYISKGPQLFQLDESGRKSNVLAGILAKNYGEVALKDLSAQFAFVSYDMANRRPFLFTCEDKKYRNISLARSLAACSAVPGYFDPVSIGNHQLVDGIETAKNPSLIAYEYARKIFPDDLLILLSLGTGQLTGEHYDAMEREVDNVHETLLEKEKDRENQLVYHRFQPALHSAEQEMDAASPENIQALMDDADSFIASEKNRFKKLMEQWR
ncbi:MAG: patatin-like phospholipase family protein [Bacteroidota bacterium]